MKDGYNALQVAGYEGKLKGEIISVATYIDYLRKNLNTTHICEGGVDDPTKPCNINNRSDRTNYFRATLTTGMTIGVAQHFEVETGKLASVLMYINANSVPAPANPRGWLAYNYTDNTVTNTAYGTTTARPGELVPVGLYANGEDGFWKASYGL